VLKVILTRCQPRIKPNIENQAMINFKNTYLPLTLLLLLQFTLVSFHEIVAQTKAIKVEFELSFPEPEQHTYRVEMNISGYEDDTMVLHMPRWMPGYYQIMDYAKGVVNLEAQTETGKKLLLKKSDLSSWKISGLKGNNIEIHYEIRTERSFVALSYVDNEHAYIAPCNTWLYMEDKLDLPARVKVILPEGWTDVATGLDPVTQTPAEFTAKNFDILYDCPILTGKLEELPSFKVQGVPHRFIGYKVGEFDRAAFMDKLKKSVEAAVEIMGDIPYKHYTFIGIGPGMGGIEHLNSTTISFDGNRLNSEQAMNNTLSFITHEYFHHYNVKRIRPVELGPFDYQRENRTTQLWVSEGLTVYYEYIVMKRAGLINDEQFLQYFSDVITASENDPGKVYQSLSESSFRTWDEGPFGVRGGKDTAITYYEKGPVVGLLLDFAIRNASGNQHSLDDVMWYLYYHHYKELHRGFTDAEFQQVCETMAGKKLDEIFEYINTTQALNYDKYLDYAGLKLTIAAEGDRDRYSLRKKDELSKDQQKLLNSWLTTQ